MSTSEPRVRLEVVAGDPASQVVVIDSSLAPVAKGLNTLSTELPPGIYKVRVITAGQIREQLADLEADKGPVRIELPPIEFASPAPLRATKASARQMEAADEQSRRIHADLHGNSELFFFVRGPGSAGAVLTGTDGAVLVSLDEAGARGGDGEDWQACNVALPPGAYRLAARAGQEWLAQTVVASEGWQTQVFLQGEEGVLNLANAAMFIVRRGRGFHPSEEELRLTELARIGLSNRRQILSERDINTLADGKFEDPMLGLFAAHLLLLRRGVDVERLRRIVSNLRALLGAHPDVAALELATRAPGQDRLPEPFPDPPMLARSYRLIVERSATSPELVPDGSILAKIATHLWGGAGPWLVFTPPEAGGPRAFFESMNEPPRPPSIHQVSAGDLQRLAEDPEQLDPTEEAVLQYVNHPVRGGRLDEGQLVRALGLPPAVLRHVYAGIASKALRLPPLERKPPPTPAREGRWAAALSKGTPSARDASFPLGVERLERAVLRCARRQDKARAWADVDGLEAQVKESILSPRSLSPSETSALREAYDVWERVLGRYRRELPATAELSRRRKKAERKRLAGAVRAVLLGIKTMSAGLRMGETGASTFRLGSRTIQSVKERLER